MSFYLRTCVLLASGALGLATPALAQTPNDPPSVGEITVTGQKRQATLQDSDSAITVISSQDIEQARLRDFSQLDDMAPNVQFNTGGQLGNVFITIRGVESNPFIVNRAAVYIDGIPFRELTNAVLSQVESIEVLRGPQGALYGANSESGLIVIRTRNPKDRPERELRATLTRFSGSGGYDLEGYFSQPFAETLSGSLALKYSDEATWMRNRNPAVTEPGQIGQAFMQGKLRWTPTDRTVVNATAYILDINAPGVFDNDFFSQDTGLYDSLYRGYNGGLNSGRDGYFRDAPARTDETEYVFGLSGTHFIGEGAIDAALSYRRDRSDARGLDFDFTSLPTAAGQDINDEKVWNAELRYTSDQTRPLSFLAGAAYFKDDKDNQKATFVGPGTMASYNRAPVQTRSIASRSAFGSVRWKPGFLPNITLSGGLRYDETEQDAVQRAGMLDLGGGSVLYYTDASLRATDHAVLPRYSLTWEPSDDATVYLSAAKGTIPGGFNLAATQEGITDPEVLRYQAETMWSYELGLRLRSADRRLRGSAAIFQIKSDNWQEIRVLTDASGRPVSSDFIGSSASVLSRGFEMEASWQPARALTVAASYGFVDSTYEHLFTGTEDLAGNPVKLVPRYDGAISVRYQASSGVFARIAVNLTGAMTLDEKAYARQGATTTVDLQLGYDAGEWSARLFADNLTDERRFSGLAFDNLTFGRDGTVYGALEAPRVIGFELQREF